MFRSLLVGSAFVFSASALAAEPAPNALSPVETRAGWRLLWDGHSLAGWHGVKAEMVAGRWSIADGVLTVKKAGGRPGTDLISDENFSNFELVVEFKVTPGANSGIKTFVSMQKGGAVGLEYQIIDDALHPDAKLGKDGDRTLASLYDLYPASTAKRARPVGEWNIARIISRGRHVEHWLNGEKVTEYDRGSEDFRQKVAESKFKGFPNFGEQAEGPILLQDHGDEVSFRNIKLRSLPAKG